jgi:hypothetical protein
MQELISQWLGMKTERKGVLLHVNCQERGHMARYCRKPKKLLERRGNLGKREVRITILAIGKQQPTDGPVY